MGGQLSKILIVDDDPRINKLMQQILQDEGYTLYYAENGREGVDLALSIHPDLIFLDLLMPVLDGIGFLKELNERNSFPCPILAITGGENDQDLGEYFDQGIISLIRKPFFPNEIKALCHRYTKVNELKKQLSFNLDTVMFLSKQASHFGLDNISEQELIEALPLPVFVKNREQVVIQVNKALEHFTGMNREVIVGKRCEEISSDKQFIAQNHETELHLFENGGVSCQELMVTYQDSKVREVIICRAAVTCGADTQPVAILGVMIDITEFGFSNFKKLLVEKYPNLSVREREVAYFVRLGMSNKELARQLNIALSTVEYHRANLREKLGMEKGDKRNLSTVLLSMENEHN